MGGRSRSRAVIMGALVGGEPMSCREVMGATGLSKSQVYMANVSVMEAGAGAEDLKFLRKP